MKVMYKDQRIRLYTRQGKHVQAIWQRVYVSRYGEGVPLKFTFPKKIRDIIISLKTDQSKLHRCEFRLNIATLDHVVSTPVQVHPY